jgi:hypothetical protein
MEHISEPKNPNELCCGECKIAGVFTVAQKKQSGGLVPLSLDQKRSTKRSTISAE